jgi:hypothetical protein
VTGTDGDEFTIKDGIKVSKISKEAMEIGFDVNESLKVRVHELFTSYVLLALKILIYLITEHLFNNKQGKIGIAHELRFLVRFGPVRF